MKLWDRLESGYNTYKAEILTAASVAIPALLAKLTTIEILEPVRRNLYTYLALGSTLLLGIAYTQLRRQHHRLQDAALAPSKKPHKQRYRDIVDAACSTYYLLGMSAEEFQRDVAMGDYFEQRADEGRPFSNMRFLLLHPDSPHFRNRLADVHPKANVEELVHRKSELIRSLHCGLRALPKRAIESYEIRLYDEFPTWMIQFYDVDQRGSGDTAPPVDHLVVMVNMPGRHSKLGPRYLLARTEPALFDSFLAHFSRLWNSAVPINDDGTFPSVPTPPPSKIRAIVFDMDGTVLDTNDMKREVFFLSARQAVPSLPQSDDHAYGSLSYQPRDRLFEQYVRRTLHRPPTDHECKVFATAYKREVMSGLQSVHAMAGFPEFATRMKGRYKLFVASTAPQDEVDALLDAAGTAHFFCRTFGSPTSKVRAIQSIVESDRLGKQTVLYVGDHADDQIVAETAGTHYCRLAVNKSEVIETGTGKVVRSFDEMIGVLFDLELLNHDG